MKVVVWQWERKAVKRGLVIKLLTNDSFGKFFEGLNDLQYHQV